MEIIRVFPRRTKLTPIDDMAFIGDPPLLRPRAGEVHVSVSFTWDIQEGLRLKKAWEQYYPVVKIGGLPFGKCNGEFVPGLYVRPGVTFTTYGCDKKCPWCLVSQYEGRFRELATIQPGHILQDNNVLMATCSHLFKVFEMLKKQKEPVTLAGGLDSELLTDWAANQIRSLRINQIFLSADYDAALKPLEIAVSKLSLPREKLRCYVLVGYNEALDKAINRLMRVWDIGCMPFAQLYQPPDKYIKYSRPWLELARKWARPAIMKSMLGEKGSAINVRPL